MWGIVRCTIDWHVFVSNYKCFMWTEWNSPLWRDEWAIFTPITDASHLHVHIIEKSNVWCLNSLIKCFSCFCAKNNIFYTIFIINIFEPNLHHSFVYYSQYFNWWPAQKRGKNLVCQRSRHGACHSNVSRLTQRWHWNAWRSKRSRRRRGVFGIATMPLVAAIMLTQTTLNDLPKFENQLPSVFLYPDKHCVGNASSDEKGFKGKKCATATRVRMFVSLSFELHTTGARYENSEKKNKLSIFSNQLMLLDLMSPS